MAIARIGRPPLEEFRVASDSVTSATDVLMVGMTITPGVAGNYLATFSSSFDHSSNNESIFFNLYCDGVLVPDTEREFRRGGGAGDIAAGPSLHKYLVNVGVAHAIEIRWRTTSPTGTVYERNLIVEKAA